MARQVELAKSSRFILLASVCVVIGALYFGHEVLVPLALAILLSFLLSPLVHHLERFHLPRAAATLVVVLASVAFLVAVGYLVERQFVSVVNELPKYRGELRTKLRGISLTNGLFGKAEKEIKQISDDTPPATQPASATLPGTLGPTRVRKVDETKPDVKDIPLVRVYAAPAGPLDLVTQYATTILTPLATAGLVLILVFFMLMYREDLRDRVIRLVGYGQLNLTTTALDEGATRVSRYLGALAMVNGLYAGAVALGLWLDGLIFGGHGQGFPNVLVWGLLVGIFRFVPYVGVWLGASIPLLLAFALFPGYGAFFAALALFVTLELVVSNFVEPFLYGSSTGMSALAVLVAAVFWTWLWGPVGLLLSTPLTVVLVVLGKYVPQLRFLEIILGDEPVLDLPTRLYQRLLALDEEEATELARAQIEDEGKSLLETYDQVLLPALSMAEVDRRNGRLDAERRDFVREGIGAIAEELADLNRQRLEQAAQKVVSAAQKNEAGPASADGQAVEVAASLATAAVPAGCTVNIVCLPAHDKLDEVAAAMLGQLLEERRYCAFVISHNALASEMVDAVGKHAAHAVVVSALPPEAVSHSRYLCKRLEARFEQLSMIIGLWRSKSEMTKSKKRIACKGSTPVVTTFAQALEAVQQQVQPAILAMTPAPTEAAAVSP